MTSSLRSKELSTWMRILRIDPFITVLPLMQKRWRKRNGRTQFCISYPPTPSSLSRFIVTKSSVWILPRLLLLLAIPLLLLWFFLCLQDEKYFFVKLWSSKTIPGILSKFLRTSRPFSGRPSTDMTGEPREMQKLWLQFSVQEQSFCHLSSVLTNNFFEI